MESLLIFILIFMLIAAVVALWTDELLSAVIAFGAVGFGSSAAFLILGAPDLAITQIVVEVAALVLLIKVTIGIGVRTVSGRSSYRRLAIAGGVTILLFVFVLLIFTGLPQFGSPVMDRIPDAPSITYLEMGLEHTGSANLVMGVLLDFRGYDTLGEATVIFTAVLGALALMRKRGVKTGDNPEREERS